MQISDVAIVNIPKQENNPKTALNDDQGTTVNLSSVGKSEYSLDLVAHGFPEQCTLECIF